MWRQFPGNNFFEISLFIVQWGNNSRIQIASIYYVTEVVPILLQYQSIINVS